MHGPPARHPIGLHLTQVAKVVSRAFDDALAQAGGSLPMWLVLLNVETGKIKFIYPTTGQVLEK